MDTNSQLRKQEGIENKDQLNLMQKHVMFFDRNNDGIIYPSETYQGFRALGFGIFRSCLAGFLINIALSRKSRPGKPFSLLFPIEVKNITMNKHRSDSGVYDNEGRFITSKFEEIFTEHAHTNKDSLTSEELKAFVKSKREPKKYFSWLLAYMDWKFLYDLGKDEQGLLQKDTIRSIYDGSFFEQVVKDRASKKQ